VKLPRWFPQPAAWAGAVALFVYAGVVSIAMAAVMPLIAELMRASPRLGWLAILATWVSPIGGAALLHHTAHGLLDLGDTQKVARRASSAWAGFVAWATILLVSLTTSFVMLVIDPPPADPDALWNLATHITQGPHVILRAVVWIVLAAHVYTLERAARRDV
jgi:hypothetical protein